MLFCETLTQVSETWKQDTLISFALNFKQNLNSYTLKFSYFTYYFTAYYSMNLNKIKLYI